MQIAFLGVGYMGYGMALNLMKSGHSLRVIAHRNRGRIEKLVAQGASECSVYDQLLNETEAVISCVGTAEQMEAIAKQAEAYLKAGTLWIDCTTSRLDITLAIAAQFKKIGVGFIDAPVTRGPKDAEAGNLISFVGAEKAVFERARPLIECYSESVTHLGPVGSGLRVKLINNFITMGQVALVIEAMQAADRAGIDRRSLFEILVQGAAKSGTLLKMMSPALQGDFSGHAFSLQNAAKDVAYGRQLLKHSKTGTLLGETLSNYYSLKLENNPPDLLLSELLRPEKT